MIWQLYWFAFLVIYLKEKAVISNFWSYEKW